jgi:uncharacterized protein YbjT (DUF2867 family)
MNIVLFGATGMVGQGVLRECLLSPDVSSVLAIGRSPLPQQHPKLRSLVHADLHNYESISADLKEIDAAYFCLGITSAGMSEPDYTRITYDITLAAANALAALNSRLTFIYISGVGADSTENGRTMWARVRGKTENALLRLPIHAYILRPGVIIPLHGIQSRTTLYRVLYSLTSPIFPLLQRLFPKQILTTEEVGQAMLKLTKSSWPKKILEPPDVHALLNSQP